MSTRKQLKAPAEARRGAVVPGAPARWKGATAEPSCA
jgi:hypothetical protein